MKPVTLPVWQSAVPARFSELFPTVVPIWQAQSLTAVLRGLGRAFSVELLFLGEGTEEPYFQDVRPSESAAVFVRDVLLCLDSEPVVKARSVCPTDSHNWRGVLDCGTRPLGERLFDGTLPLLRSDFEFADLSGRDDFPAQALARRSVFDWHGERLGLMECFLPALAHYLPE